MVAGWFEGVTVEQLTRGAVEHLRHGTGFALQWWGLADARSGDRAFVEGLERGDRALEDARRENSGSPMDREEWITAKALAAHPMPFSGFLRLGARSRGDRP